MYVGDFRRNSVNQLIKSVYNKIKGINISFEFSIVQEEFGKIV